MTDRAPRPETWAPCVRCHGVGEFEGSVLNGPSWMTTLIPCADCGGAGRVNRDWKERGYRINQFREQRDRSRREFAKEIGVPAPLLAIVETGICPPDEVERILRQKGFLS